MAPRAPQQLVPGDHWASLPCSFRRLVVRSVFAGPPGYVPTLSHARSIVASESSQTLSAPGQGQGPLQWLGPKLSAPFVAATVRWMDIMERIFVAGASGAEAARAASRLDDLRRRTSDGVVRVSPDTLGELYPDLGELVRDGASGLLSFPALAHLYASLTLTFVYSCSCRWHLWTSEAGPQGNDISAACEDHVLAHGLKLEHALKVMHEADTTGMTAFTEKACGSVIILNPMLPEPFRLRANARLKAGNRWWCLEDLRLYLLLSARDGFCPRTHADAYWCMADAFLKELDHRVETQKGLFSDSDFCSFVEQADFALQMAFRYDRLDKPRSRKEPCLAQSAAARHFLQRIEDLRGARRTGGEMLDLPVLQGSTRGYVSDSDQEPESCAVPWPIDLSAGLSDVALFSRTPTIGSSVQHEALELLFLDARNVLDLLATMQSLAARSTAFAIRNAENLHWKHRPKPVHAQMQVPRPERLAHMLVCMFIAKQVGTVLDGGTANSAAGKAGPSLGATAIRGPSFSIEETSYDRFLCGLFTSVVFCRKLTPKQQAELNRLLSLLIFISMDMQWMRRTFPWLDLDDHYSRARRTENSQEESTQNNDEADDVEAATGQDGWWPRTISGGRAWGTSLVLFQLQHIWIGWLSATSGYGRPSFRQQSDSHHSSDVVPLGRLDESAENEAACRTVLKSSGIDDWDVEGFSQRRLWVLHGHLPAMQVGPVDFVADDDDSADDYPVTNFSPPNRRLRWQRILHEQASLQEEHWRVNPCVLDPVSWALDAGALTDPFRALSWRIRRSCIRRLGGEDVCSEADKPWLVPPHELRDYMDCPLPASGGSEPLVLEVVWEHMMEQLKSLSTVFNTQEAADAVRANHMPKLLRSHVDEKDIAGARDAEVKPKLQLPRRACLENALRFELAKRAGEHAKDHEADMKEVFKPLTQKGIDREVGMLKLQQHQAGLDSELRDYVTLASVRKREAEAPAHARVRTHRDSIMDVSDPSVIPTWHPAPVTCAPIRFRLQVCASSHWQVARSASSLGRTYDAIDAKNLLILEAGILGLCTWFDTLLKPSPYAYIQTRQCEEIFQEMCHGKKGSGSGAHNVNVSETSTQFGAAENASVLDRALDRQGAPKPVPPPFVKQPMPPRPHKGTVLVGMSSAGASAGLLASPVFDLSSRGQAGLKRWAPFATQRAQLQQPSKQPRLPKIPGSGQSSLQASAEVEFESPVPEAAASESLASVRRRSSLIRRRSSTRRASIEDKVQRILRTNAAKRIQRHFLMKVADGRNQELAKEMREQELVLRVQSRFLRKIRLSRNRAKRESIDAINEKDETQAAEKVQDFIRPQSAEEAEAEVLEPGGRAGEAPAQAPAPAESDDDVDNFGDDDVSDAGDLAAEAAAQCQQLPSHASSCSEASVTVSHAEGSNGAQLQAPRNRSTKKKLTGVAPVEKRVPGTIDASGLVLSAAMPSAAADSHIAAPMMPAMTAKPVARTPRAKAALSNTRMSELGADLPQIGQLPSHSGSSLQAPPAPKARLSLKPASGVEQPLKVLSPKSAGGAEQLGPLAEETGQPGVIFPGNLSSAAGDSPTSLAGECSPRRGFLSRRNKARSTIRIEPDEQQQQATLVKSPKDSAVVTLKLVQLQLSTDDAAGRAGESQAAADASLGAGAGAKESSRAPDASRSSGDSSSSLAGDKPEAVAKKSSLPTHAGTTAGSQSPCATAEAPPSPAASAADAPRSRSAAAAGADAEAEAAVPPGADSDVSSPRETLRLRELRARILLTGPSPRARKQQAPSSEATGARPVPLPPYVAQSDLFDQLVRESLSTAVTGQQLQQLLGVVARAEPIWSDCGLCYYGASEMLVCNGVFSWDSTLESIPIVAKNWPCAAQYFSGTAVGRIRDTSQQKWVAAPPATSPDVEHEINFQGRPQVPREAGPAVVGPRLVRLRRSGFHPRLVGASMCPPQKGSGPRYCANTAFCTKLAADSADILAGVGSSELHCHECNCAWYCSSNCEAMHRAAHSFECRSLIALRAAGDSFDASGQRSKRLHRNKRLLTLMLEQIMSKHLPVQSKKTGQSDAGAPDALAQDDFTEVQRTSSLPQAAFSPSLRMKSTETMDVVLVDEAAVSGPSKPLLHRGHPFQNTAAALVRLLPRWSQMGAPALREVLDDGMGFGVVTGRGDNRDSASTRLASSSQRMAASAHRMALHIAASQQWRIIAPTLVAPKDAANAQGIGCAQYGAYYAFFQPVRMPFAEQPPSRPVACIVWSDRARDAVLNWRHSAGDSMRSAEEALPKFMEILSEHIGLVQILDGVMFDVLTGKAVFLLYSSLEDIESLILDAAVGNTCKRVSSGQVLVRRRTKHFGEASNVVSKTAWAMLLDAEKGLEVIASPVPVQELRHCSL